MSLWSHDMIAVERSQVQREMVRNWDAVWFHLLRVYDVYHSIRLWQFILCNRFGPKQTVQSTETDNWRGNVGHGGTLRGTLHAEREKLCIFLGLFLSHSFCRSTRCLRNLWVMATWRETVRASKNQMISHVEQRSSWLGPLNCHAKVYISSMHFARWTTASWTTSTRSKPRRNLVKDHMARPSARIIKT